MDDKLSRATEPDPAPPSGPDMPDPSASGPPPDPALMRRRTICLGVLMLQGIYFLVGIGAIPSLIGSDPVLLELLRGSTAAMVAGGAFARVGRASLVLAVLAPVPTLLMSAPVAWWAGRLWGPDVVELIAGRGAQARRGVQRAMRIVERGRSWGIVFNYLLPIPSVIIWAAAGWTGMGLLRFLVLDLIGTFIWIGLIVGLGYALGHPAVHVAHAISHYALFATIAIVVLSVGWSVWRTSRLPADPLDM